MKSKYVSTKVIELGSCAFRQWRASHSHCRFIHGYQLKAKIWFGAKHLDDRNWVVDFGGLKDLKDILQKTFDHTFTVAADDPELETFKMLNSRGIVDLRVFESGVGIEKVAEHVFNIANEFTINNSQGRCWVEKVEVFEHEYNSALYIPSSTESFNQPQYNVSIDGIQSNDSVPTSLNNDVDLPQPSRKVGSPARVTPNVTRGKSNWFAGTTWG
jgi:6-pyruvoyltetrahydropterin/6-carboxytetrahydropterin synthase